ncbi:hypothetical protein KHU32_15775 [Roseococcus sp. XZZS9]|uniref:Uncharacterized protein n=1 Tax=Roseococcus pinisoli TaxID=2835040 RepID=A0ABS5QFR3_9PROT|nr:hypothetical protein [uncultured Roseococcus sp.]MBS7812409.1 hypothetical protein [Roseococcus pinisoli]
MSMLRAEIKRRARHATTDRKELVETVLKERTPPGWRYQLYPVRGAEEPDFLLIPATMA